jgi:2-oxoglutarate dehydrogenase complex, dehydrogenase (E1) component, and related enzymes
VIFTPKSLLRARTAHSKVTSLEEGGFLEILDDPYVDGATYDAGPARSNSEDIQPDTVRRVILCSGKVAYDALAWRAAHLERAQVPTALVRIEQLYPWPEGKLLDVLARYPGMSEVVFLQEEPENMGAWSYAHERLHRLFGSDITFRHVSREASASTATGSAAKHRLEQEDILQRAVG